MNPPSLTTTKKRGRPPGGETDRFRALTWYYAVKDRGNWSDYRLSKEFGSDDGSTADRQRIFENIRKDARMPATGTYQQRTLDIIERVERHPDFHGTAPIFHSQYWELLKNPPSDITTAQVFVRDTLIELGLVRLEGKLAKLWDDQVNQLGDAAAGYFDVDPLQRYLSCLSIVIEAQPDPLKRLTLLGSLYREALLVGHKAIYLQISRLFSEGLMAFCCEPWMAMIALDFYHFSQRQILYTLAPDQFNTFLAHESPYTKISRLIMDASNPAVAHLCMK